MESSQRRLEATLGMSGRIAAECSCTPFIGADGKLILKNLFPEVSKQQMPGWSSVEECWCALSPKRESSFLTLPSRLGQELLFGPGPGWGKARSKVKDVRYALPS